MSGKGSNRRRENREAVEANWPTTWDAREGSRALTDGEELAAAFPSLPAEALAELRSLGDG